MVHRQKNQNANSKGKTMPNQLQVTAREGKTLVGRRGEDTAVAQRITVDSDYGHKSTWLLTQNGKPMDLASTWDEASTKLRQAGFKVRAEGEREREEAAPTQH